MGGVEYLGFDLTPSCEYMFCLVERVSLCTLRNSVGDGGEWMDCGLFIWIGRQERIFNIFRKVCSD